jgi:ubiquinone/menaquinone biosynthesis C-methylase UbiE
MNHYSTYIKGVCGDIGCNMGACTLLLLNFKDKIESIYGLDMNCEALKIAYDSANSQNNSTKIYFVYADLLKNPMKNETFDFLMSFHVLEHIYPEDSVQFVNELYRILKPGGYLVLSIPYERAYPDTAHVAFYNVESVCKLFEGCGFYTIECMKDNRWKEKELLTALFTKPIK